MRDEYDARFWNDHHRVFSATVADGVQRLGNTPSFRRKSMTSYHDIRLQLVAALAALSMSSLTVLGTVGPIDDAAPEAGSLAETGADNGQAA